MNKLETYLELYLNFFKNEYNSTEEFLELLKNMSFDSLISKFSEYERE